MSFIEINQIDVSERIEKKMNLSYLSWAWAHQQMKLIDENAEIKIHEFPDYQKLETLANMQVEITPDLLDKVTTNYKQDAAGAYVTVSVTLQGRTETESLPVMDFKNKAMTNPTSMDVNKAHKRCFVKALALHGLGLYVYAGEDLPEAPKVEKVSKKQADEIVKLLKEFAENSDEDQADVRMGRHIVGKFASEGNKVTDIDKINFTPAKNYLKGLIEKNKPKQNEQDSLFEGNSTKVKGD